MRISRLGRCVYALTSSGESSVGNRYSPTTYDSFPSVVGIPVLSDLYTTTRHLLGYIVSTGDSEQLRSCDCTTRYRAFEKREYYRWNNTMMKHVAIFFAIFYVVHSQRPPYAGSSDRSRYPQVLPQYIEEQAAGISLGNRINTDNSVTSFASTTTAIPFDLPVDALGDIELINRIKTWPREKQPFWYLNWIQIQEHRGDTRHQTQPVAPTTRMQNNRNY